MARVPRKLILLFTAQSIRDLAEIWDWNAITHGEIRAKAYVNFLRSETRKLTRFDAPGRVIPADPALRYHLIKRRSAGFGHVIIFWIEEEILHVFRYFHSSQDWESKLSRNPESDEPTS